MRERESLRFAVHRRIEIIADPNLTDELVDGIRQIDDVIGVAVVRSGSVKPMGDLIAVTALNRAANDVMRRAEGLQDRGRLIVVTSDVASITDRVEQERIENDIDEELWEEMETGLRHTSKVNSNFVGLMALGGAVSAVGLVEHGVPQAIAFVASSIIAPGFDPLAKFPMGVVLGSAAVAKRALVSVIAGYAALLSGSAAAMLFLRTAGLAHAEEIRSNAELLSVMGTGPTQNLVSLCGAVAGMIMIASYREEVLAGPLIAMALIPAASMTGAMPVLGEWGLLQIAGIRFALDMLTVVVTAAVFVWAKQRRVHRREPML
jgi:hypothetical protein